MCIPPLIDYITRFKIIIKFFTFIHKYYTQIEIFFTTKIWNFATLAYFEVYQKLGLKGSSKFEISKNYAKKFDLVPILVCCSKFFSLFYYTAHRQFFLWSNLQ